MHMLALMQPSNVIRSRLSLVILGTGLVMAASGSGATGRARSFQVALNRATPFCLLTIRNSRTLHPLHLELFKGAEI